MAGCSCLNNNIARKNTVSPNVILIITDDMGYGDIARHGNPLIKTPNLDVLYEQSVRFTNFHTDPTCSPTRAALLTGKYSHRVGVWHTFMGGNYLRKNEETMAEVFKNSGYCTAIFGKWHLGGNYPYRPIDRGFDEWLGQGDMGTGTTEDYFYNDRVNDVYLHNGERTKCDGFGPDVIFEYANQFIKFNGRKQPFFVYLSTYAPHHPNTIPEKSWADKYESKTSIKNAFYYATIERLDRNIGMLRKCLKKNNLEDNTILLFMSDNGANIGADYFNSGMRGVKGQPYEGGHRVPFFFYWPKGRIMHGSEVNDLTAHIDILPTLIDICELNNSENSYDGRSFKKQLFQPDVKLPPRTLFVEAQRTIEPVKWHNTAAMTNRWRLINNKELYDIILDPGQTHDIYDQYSEVVAQIQKDFDIYWQNVTPNDRERPVTVIGSPFQKEIFLTSADWYVSDAPWNHALTACGPYTTGSWKVLAYKKGKYNVEVRRWPIEADAPITGKPEFKKQMDAWGPNGAKTHLIYNETVVCPKTEFTCLPVKYIELKIGDFKQTKPVHARDKYVNFIVDLKKQLLNIEANMLDNNRNLIAGAYYVYIKPA